MQCKGKDEMIERYPKVERKKSLYGTEMTNITYSNYMQFKGKDEIMEMYPKVARKKKGPHDVKLGQISPPVKHTLKFLSVFANFDHVGEVFTKAAEKLGFEVTAVNTDVNALEEYQAKFHDLVLIDTRSNKGLDYETLCRSK
ncbi:unnamed protein product [Acanthoscelides obtectus]|uniref:PDE8-like REC N-terminal domain-containing protein n=1 Tax=Acanthoscelides obtectus TaxID=200917 RepID=A0A9P0P0G0_ACAOB|nr:unnamed protein product [Acanthoscelides obtectus]CAK1658493.1 High affinity cAMP-specific and IBMX-insensitive 3',5'-cyclic phosphodiesterase 8A [Acanthoscelides obtectus]